MSMKYQTYKKQKLERHRRLFMMNRKDMKAFKNIFFDEHQFIHLFDKVY